MCLLSITRHWRYGLFLADARRTNRTAVAAAAAADIVCTAAVATNPATATAAHLRAHLRFLHHLRR